MAPPEKKRLDNVSSHKWVHEMWLLTKSLDPTRLVLEASGRSIEALEQFESVFAAQPNYPDVAAKIRELRR